MITVIFCIYNVTTILAFMDLLPVRYAWLKDAPAEPGAQISLNILTKSVE